MNTRLATADDFPEIVRMGRMFWSFTAWRDIPYCEESIKSFCSMMLDSGTLVCIEENGKPAGFAGSVIGPLLGNMNFHVAAELFWWIEPEHRNAGAGKMLLSALEDAARNAGANINAMMALETVEPDKAEAIYRRAGYHPTERAFQKVLQ